MTKAQRSHEPKLPEACFATCPMILVCTDRGAMQMPASESALNLTTGMRNG